MTLPATRARRHASDDFPYPPDDEGDDDEEGEDDWDGEDDDEDEDAPEWQLAG